ncbi:receptor-type tyrosine-protein phosphatase kappa-like [Apostichopus japonicus]|uniref:receptor-type tyrosine-protein phosphatase kappa-like n=1 Tax=Stichopus japonicus TaxID=307972 RepID=UPI003AB53418
MPLAIIIVFPLVAIVILVVLVSVGVIIYKRRSPSKEPDGEYHPRLTVTNPVYSEDSESAMSQPDEIVAIDDKSIKISDLATYVKQKKENRADNFFTEFETLPSNKLHPWTVAEKPENKTKNRYGNILPYDNSRVVLDKVNGDPHSDYINASYIDGYKAPKMFIASHGPNKDSVVDFWRMVWQENVSTIVMLTPLVEKEKFLSQKKCLKYWPDQEMIYGEFLVKCQKLEEHSKYDQRILTVFLKHGGESRTVKHFHFTDWSDMKIPEFLDPILDFLEIVKNTSQKNVPNTIVHCSAGVGRTGTYITLDAMLDMAQAEGKVNVYKFVTEMRQRRFMSVQIQDQYQFVFDALVKHFCIGRTTMSVDSFRVELASLKDTNKKTNETFLTEQFKKLEETSTTPSSSDVSEAKKMENRSRNRFSTILPVEEHRPFLMTNVGENYNNYINASFLNGYKKRDFFIATQMPLKNTILDFWRLVWDYECSVIIMLNELDDKDEQYWPETSPVTFSPFTIVPLSSDVNGSICVRKMEVTNTARQSQNIRTVMQMQCLGWPNNETVANSPELLLHCVHQLSQWCKESAIDRVLVHCMDGVGRTGVFCGLVAALDQAQAVNEVDIFQLISNMRSAQPLMIQNLEQYQCIFDAVLIHLETRSSTYTNLPFRSEQSRREC